MSERGSDRFESLEPRWLEEQLRRLAENRAGAGIVDDLELRHLVSVILHGALLVQDLYASARVGSIYAGDAKSFARNILSPLTGEPDRTEGDVLARAGRLPDEVRLLGDKCLFDVGISRMRHYRGFDLQELGIRAYRMASEVLQILAEDRKLRELFERNEMSPLPISEEVAFLNQCAERFKVHADLLLHLPHTGSPGADVSSGVVLHYPRNDSAIGPAMLSPPAPVSAPPPKIETPPASDFESARLSREDLLSTYERIILFSTLEVETLRSDLKGTVIDQPSAVDALCDECALYAAGTHNLSKPPSYFFVGPTGVGKNHLVETLVRQLGQTWGIDVPFLTIDGPNYTDASDINELRGSTRGFIRSDEEGLLSEFHSRSSQTPIAVILVDEVEKAHPHLRKFFLSLMDRGTVTDNRGRTLSFANTILFFTSNIGYSEAVQRGVPIGYRGDESKEAFERSEVDRGLRQALSAEFVNRLRIIRFEHLSRASIEKIFDLEFGKVRGRFREIHGIDLVVAPAGREEILSRGYSAEFGARHLAGVINQVANVEVSKRLKRDDKAGNRASGEILDYLRTIRSKQRAFDPRDVRARVLEAARVRVSYSSITIDFQDGAFAYLT